jgi:5-formyltetrahydrofolate cyclo-ligase
MFTLSVHTIKRISPSKAALRRLLLAQRLAMPRKARLQADAKLQSQLLAWCLTHTQVGDAVALFAPHLGEPDIVAIAQALQAAQRSVCLPVVVGKAAPLQFAAWAWGDVLAIDVYGIAVPAKQIWVRPAVVVLPCVGFMQLGGQFFRLGYGGGFYDRTLAALETEGKVRTVGVAFAASRSLFEVAAHDAPLDEVLTA